MTCGKGKKNLPCHFREGVPEYPPSVRPSFLTHKHCKHVSMIELLVSAFQTGVVFFRDFVFYIFFFFGLGHFSLLFATFWRNKLYFDEFWSICTVHRFFHTFPWRSLIYPKFSSIFP